MLTISQLLRQVLPPPAAEADISSDRNEDSRKASSEVDDPSEASSAASEVSPVPEASVTSEPTVSPEPKGMIALTFDDGPVILQTVFWIVWKQTM